MTGGDGATSGGNEGCGASGGRIAMYFANNFTFSGSWDVYGGDATTPECDGASGTAFFYHTGLFNGCILLHCKFLSKSKMGTGISIYFWFL